MVKSVLRFALKATALLLGVLVIGVCVLAAIFVLSPEFFIGGQEMRLALERYLPKQIEITFDDLETRVTIPEGHLLAKRLSLKGKNLCVRYRGEAVRACFSEVDIGASAGLRGPLSLKRKWFIPHLISIDPIILLGGDVGVDLRYFPEPDPSRKESSFDFFDFLRTEVLPVWKIEGSRVEIANFIFRARKDQQNEGISAKFDLTTEREAKAVVAKLSTLKLLGSQLHAEAVLRLVNADKALQDAGPKSTYRRWKLFGDGRLALDKKRTIRFRADSDIESWRSLDFRASAVPKGIASLKDVRVDGALREDELDGRLSLKMGAAGSRVRALDFANCRIGADLEKKTGRLLCGPQAVRLQLTEAAFLRQPRFFTFSPEFELRVQRLNFAEVKSADFELDLDLAHFDVVEGETRLMGHVHKAPREDWRFQVEGSLGLAVQKFEKVAKLLRKTPYSVPAPLNVLKGRVGVEANLAFNERGGDIDYHASSNLDSQNQSVHLRFNGRTALEKVEKGFKPATDAVLLIDRLKLSAPRFDLRAPPRLRVDPRFLRTAAVRVKEDKSAPARSRDIRLQIKTTSHQAIQVATSITRRPIPLDLDIVYSGRGPTTGSVAIGRTPVEIFHREGVLEELRVDLLESGNRRLKGRASVDSLDYHIGILVSGFITEPQVKFISDPPLEDDQILSVLLFGRPLNDLQEEDRTSVSNLNAAFADAALGLSSLFLLANTPIESVGYDAERELVTAQVGLGGGASLELGSGGTNTSVGIKKRLSRDFVFRSDVERIGATGQQTVSALVEWMKRF